MGVLLEDLLEVRRAGREHHLVGLDPASIDAEADVHEVIVQPVVVQGVGEVAQVVVPPQRILLGGGHRGVLFGSTSCPHSSSASSSSFSFSLFLSSASASLRSASFQSNPISGNSREGGSCPPWKRPNNKKWRIWELLRFFWPFQRETAICGSLPADPDPLAKIVRTACFVRFYGVCLRRFVHTQVRIFYILCQTKILYASILFFANFRATLRALPLQWDCHLDRQVACRQCCQIGQRKGGKFKIEKKIIFYP